ncbi:hypothetical protein [Citrobacter koseri]|uniref:hypothetical protein n=1 Tax=Citrobacter koseri TaxID=545 RepID=UPI001E4F87FD|nr:hypothetical protein [Citrobacter koseri]
MKPTYEELEAQIKQLEADNEKAMSVLKEANDAVLLAKSKFNAMAAELRAVESIHNDAVFITDEHYEQCPPQVQKMIRSLAVLQIPAYQAFLAEVRASGVDAAVEHLHQKFAGTGNIGVPVMALEHFADQLRKGDAQ